MRYHPSHTVRPIFLIGLMFAVGAAVVSGLPTPADEATAPSWSEVERLVSEQKFEAAAAEAARIREAAIEARRTVENGSRPASGSTCPSP